MTGFEAFVDALKWILKIGTYDEGATRYDKIDWKVSVVESSHFGAELVLSGNSFDIRIFHSVWPRLEAFCACGINWTTKTPAKSKALDYSDEEWKSLILLSDDDREWSGVSATVDLLKERSTWPHVVTFPLSLQSKNEIKLYTAAASYGVLWLIGHEATHAWKRHYELQEIPFKESIQRSSSLLEGFELDRTCESEADWQSAKLVYAHVLDCVLNGYDYRLAYAAGFGTCSAILMLNPKRHEIWEGAGHHDPGWMRLRFIKEAAKSANWSITEAYYPEYVASLRNRRGGLLRYDPNETAPSSDFFQKSNRTLEAFSLGEYDAIRLAQAIGDMNEKQRVVPPTHFKFGEPSDWKEFQTMVADTRVLDRRETARRQLRDSLPEDARFKGFPFGLEGIMRLGSLAARNRQSESTKVAGNLTAKNRTASAVPKPKRRRTESDN